MVPVGEAVQDSSSHPSNDLCGGKAGMFAGVERTFLSPVFQLLPHSFTKALTP